MPFRAVRPDCVSTTQGPTPVLQEYAYQKEANLSTVFVRPSLFDDAGIDRGWLALMLTLPCDLRRHVDKVEDILFDDGG